MARKPRVHEIAAEFGLDSKTTLRALRELGQYPKGPSSSIEPPVARRLRQALTAAGHSSPFPGLDGDGAERAKTLIDALPRRMPNLIDFLLHDHGSGAMTSILARAAADRWFFFAPGRAHSALYGHASTLDRFRLTDLLAPTGLALIERPNSHLLLGWVTDPGMLSLASADFSTTSGRLSVTQTQTHSAAIDEASSVILSPNTALSTLGSLSSVIPDRASGSSVARTASHDRVTEARIVDNEETRVIYATRSTLGKAAQRTTGTSASPRAGRWEVRGHWRNQWHPSVQDHERIWIAEHTAGAAEGSVSRRDRVYLLSPRASSTSRTNETDAL
ncbi:hypothetical protein GCM10010988_41600 [Cnuibacter physcomitrellae]|nr:hypothetical protein [Cnuibacter physcomitrellae]GGI42950.1 hypothetical protein GCM10010988_41600 [Cnuibacter physcomitrellae]